MRGKRKKHVTNPISPSQTAPKVSSTCSSSSSLILNPMKLLCSLPQPLPSSYFKFSNLFMQDQKNSKTRKSWYQKAMEMGSLWKTISKSTEIPTSTSATICQTDSKSPEINETLNHSRSKLRKCTSIKVATSFTRVCLCAPISSYNEVFGSDHQIPPRRSYSYPRSSKSELPKTASHERSIVGSRPSMERRRVFRGKSLTDDVLMRRFVIEEEAMMQVRRRNQMEAIKRRTLARRKKPGPSRLSRMAMASDDRN